jgi:hypothetical protein
MMLHNQGLEFSTRPQGEQQIALHYLQQSLAIAIRIHHVQHTIRNKSRGKKERKRAKRSQA